MKGKCLLSKVVKVYCNYGQEKNDGFVYKNKYF